MDVDGEFVLCFRCFVDVGGGCDILFYQNFLELEFIYGKVYGFLIFI